MRVANAINAGYILKLTPQSQYGIKLGLFVAVIRIF